MDSQSATGRRRRHAEPPCSPSHARRVRALAAMLALFAATGCQTAMSTSASSPSGAAPADATADHAAGAGTSAQWPLRFERHRFGGYCFDTYGCRIVYHGFPHGKPDDSKLSASTASFGADYQSLMKAGHIDIVNFPPPAEVSWRSKDQSEHKALIDIGEIFSDRLVRHQVAREDIAPGVSIGDPEIILEVDDRTINVYTRTFIPLKAPRDPANPNSDYRADLIKVFSQTY